MANNVNEICNSNFPERLENQLGSEVIDFCCPLTLERYAHPVRTPCNHLFEKIWIIQELEIRQRCPMCRTDLTIDDLREAYEIKDVLDQVNRYEELNEELKEEFSQYISHVKEIFSSNQREINELRLGFQELESGAFQNEMTIIQLNEKIRKNNEILDEKTHENFELEIILSIHKNSIQRLENTLSQKEIKINQLVREMREKNEQLEKKDQENAELRIILDQQSNIIHEIEEECLTQVKQPIVIEKEHNRRELYSGELVSNLQNGGKGKAPNVPFKLIGSPAKEIDFGKGEERRAALKALIMEYRNLSLDPRLKSRFAKPKQNVDAKFQPAFVEPMKEVMGDAIKRFGVVPVRYWLGGYASNCLLSKTSQKILAYIERRIMCKVRLGKMPVSPGMVDLKGGVQNLLKERRLAEEEQSNECIIL